MKTWAVIALAAGVVWHAFAEDPRIGYIYPAGGRQGTTFEVEFGGQFIRDATNLLTGADGVSAAFVKYRRELNPQEMGAYHRRLEILEATTNTLEGAKLDRARKQIEEVTQTLTDNGFDFEKKRFTRKPDPKKQPNAQIAERVVMRLTLAPDAPVGEHEVRLTSAHGISNPLNFHVGRLPEFLETDPNEAASNTNAALNVPCLINGQIMPGDVDRFRIRAQRGQQLVFETRARRLMPYLADAVPGWFQAVVALYDSEGNELAYADDYRFDPDPVLIFEVPKDGEYIVEIRDSIYRGREDFVYRMAIGEWPFITDVFPLGSRRHSEANIAVRGVNLPVDRERMKTGKEPADMFLGPSGGGDLPSNPVRFAADDLPDENETEPNNDERQSQTIAVPAAVNGRIDEPGDWDVYCFRGRAGDRLAVEVFGRRLGSPLDSVIKLTDRRGGVFEINDDHIDRAAGLITHHADSYLRFDIPKDNTYYLHIGDIQNKGGPAYAYRMHVAFNRPDFELRVVPSGVNIPAGGSAPVTVHVLRKDGFDGDVELALKDPPPGFALSGGSIPAGADHVRATLFAPSRAAEGRVNLELEGTAKVGDREIRRDAVPAEDMMQAFLYRHLVPANAWVVTVGRPARIRLALDPIEGGVLRIPVGGSAEIVLRAGGQRPIRQTPRFDLDQPPPGLSLEETHMNNKERMARIAIRADAALATPGTKGNLILHAYAGQSKNKKMVLAVLPAVPFEIVEAENVASAR
ncbi:MAG: hypothetical protein ABR497_10105 [Kiritimatiellia bacterium]